jgi:hypothetical protein
MLGGDQEDRGVPPGPFGGLPVWAARSVQAPGAVAVTCSGSCAGYLSRSRRHEME